MEGERSSWSTHLSFGIGSAVFAFSAWSKTGSFADVSDMWRGFWLGVSMPVTIAHVVWAVQAWRGK